MGASHLTTVPIDHSHSQQPVPRGFPLFKRCEWLVVNRDVAKWTSPHIIGLVYIEYLIRILTSNFLLNYLNFGDACKCVHDMCI